MVEDALALLLLDLEALPVLAHTSRRGNQRGGVIAEDVRMPGDELGVNCLGDTLEIAGVALLEEESEEVDLEQEVAELVEQLLVVVCERGIRDLVRLFDRVRDDRPRGLLTIPGAVTPQPLRQLLELEQRVREGHVLAGRRGGRVRRSRERRTGVGARLVARLVLDLAAAAVALGDLRDPGGHLLVAILLLELGTERLRHRR